MLWILPSLPPDFWRWRRWMRWFQGRQEAPPTPHPHTQTSPSYCRYTHIHPFWLPTIRCFFFSLFFQSDKQTVPITPTWTICFCKHPPQDLSVRSQSKKFFLAKSSLDDPTFYVSVLFISIETVCFQTIISIHQHMSLHCTGFHFKIKENAQ